MAKKKKTKPRTDFQKKGSRRQTIQRAVRGKKLKKRKKAKPKKTIKLRKKTKKPSLDSGFHKTKIRIIGIGGGGGSIISEIIPRVKKADFVVANTDSRALKAVKRAKRFQFGQSLTKGLGTGMNMELGEMAAQNDKDKIKKLFEGQDLCIIVACLGGGTGSGATPIFGKVSRNLGCLTYGIFTLPFEFEGEKKMEIAKESLEKIKPHLNAYSVIPNERIFQIIDKNTPLKNALSAINKRLAENLEGLIEIIYLPGLINIDFADLKTILYGRGKLAYLNTIEIEESNKEGSAKKVISTPLYPFTIKGARGILYNIVGGKDVQLLEVSQISKIISESVNKNAKIIFGINQDSKYKGQIRITLLAVGCGLKGFLAKPKKMVKPSAPFRKKIKAKPVVIAPKIEPKKKPKARKKPELKQRKVPVVKVSKSKPKPKERKPIRPISEPQKLAKEKVLVEKKPEIKIQLRKKEIKPSLPKEKKELPRQQPEPQVLAGGKVRRNGLQLKKVMEQEEKEILEQEKAWDTPAILRRKKTGNQE